MLGAHSAQSHNLGPPTVQRRAHESNWLFVSLRRSVVNCCGTRVALPLEQKSLQFKSRLQLSTVSKYLSVDTLNPKLVPVGLAWQQGSTGG